MVQRILLSLCLAVTCYLPTVVGQEKTVSPKISRKDKQEKESSPLDVVNKRMDAYNKHDLDTFLSTYSDDIQVYTYPNARVGKKGKAHIRWIFEPLFKDAAVKVTIDQQIVQGRYVVNEETVEEKGKTKRYVSIYEVKDGLIKSVRFLRE